MNTIESIIEHRVFGSAGRVHRTQLQTITPEEQKFTALQLVEYISKGMDGAVLQRISLRIPRGVLADALGAEKSNFSKLYHRTLNKLQTDEINDLTLLWAELREFFEDDSELMDEWLVAEVPALHGGRPRDLLSTISGRQSIRKKLDEMRYGDFS